MMKRLLEEEGLRGDDERLADLLRSATPFEVDPFRKRRVLISVERGASMSHHRRFWVRPAVALTLLISGTAAAAIGHHYAAPGTGFFGLSAAPSATATQAQRASSPAHRIAAVPEVAPSAEAEVLAAPEPVPATLPSAPSGTSGAPRSGARARPESAEDASNVVEAIQALRAGKDPAKAQTLLDEYLKSHPRGVLSGDALALSIEAASARNDPRAADYARRYLAIYPKGKYRDLAKRALDLH